MNRLKNLNNRKLKNKNLLEYYFDIHYMLLLKIYNYIHKLNNIDLTSIPNYLGIKNMSNLKSDQNNTAD